MATTKSGLTLENVRKLDQKLKLYCWPPYLSYSESDLTKLEKTDNFTKDTYEQAVAIYIYWRNFILPTLDKNQCDSFHLCFGQQVYNILHMFAPDHHIHLALQC